MTEYWLDIGSGADAEHWAATPACPGVWRIALDSLITSGMVASGRLSKLPPDILRVGGEIRPANSVEIGKQRSYLPFRSGVFTRVRSAFMLHLYLETLEVLAEEAHRVLISGGQLEVLLPHFADPRSEQILRRTQGELLARFGNAELAPYRGPFTTFWGELYRGRTYLIRCWKAE